MTFGSPSNRSYVTVFALVCMALLFQLTLASFGMSQSALASLGYSEQALQFWSAWAGAGDYLRSHYPDDSSGTFVWVDHTIQFQQTARHLLDLDCSHQSLTFEDDLNWQETRVEGVVSFTLRGRLSD